MELVTDRTRNAVWTLLCDLEWNWRYYDAMADKYLSRYRALRLATLVGMPIMFGLLLIVKDSKELVFGIAAGIGVLLVLLTLWDAFSDYAQDAATLRVTAHLCDDLKVETEELWRSIETYRIAPEVAEASLHLIRRRLELARGRVTLRTGADAKKEVSMLKRMLGLSVRGAARIWAAFSG